MALKILLECLFNLRDVCVKWSILTFISCDANHRIIEKWLAGKIYLILFFNVEKDL